MEGSNPHLHHNTVALWERAKELDQQENQHSEAISALTLLQSSTSSTILSQSFTSLLLIATIILYFLVWATSCHILPHLATTCHDWALAGRWVSIKWSGLTPHLHHKQGWISIKWRGLTPTCTITLLLCGREQRNWISRGQNQRSEAISALTLLQSSTSSTILSQSFTSFTIFHIFATNCYHPSLLLGLGNLLPHLATTCHDWALAGRVGLYKMEGSNPPPAP